MIGLAVSLCLHLSDALLDLDQEVSVYGNVVLESGLREREMTFSAVLDLDVR